MWEIKNVAGNYNKEIIGERGSLDLLYNNTVFIFKGKTIIISGDILSQEGSPYLNCREVLINSSIGSFAFENVS